MGKWLCLFLFFALAASAEAASVLDNYNSRLKAAAVIEPQSINDFGQSVNLQDGSISFRVTDISVPTNTGTVTFGRKLSVPSLAIDERGGGTDYNSMPAAPWELDIPYMSGTFEASYGGSWGSANPSQPFSRCTHFGNMPIIYGVGTFYQVQYTPEQYFSGISISVPGQGTESVKQLRPGTPVPADGRNYVGTTPSNWRVACLAALKRGQGEGFRVALPDGSVYHFDWLVPRHTGNVNDSTCTGANQSFYRSAESATVLGTFQSCWTDVAVPRMESFLFATEVYDRFGNKTEYNFNPANPFELTSVVYNGETLITFAYSNRRLVQATSFGRVWNYTYTSTYYRHLTSVTRPDGSQWQYDVSPSLFGINWYYPMQVYQNCLLNMGTKTTSVSPSAGETAHLAITSPSGATARFDLRKLLHGTKQGLANCYYQPVWGGGSVGPIVPFPSVYQVASLYKLTVSGPGVDTYVKNYRYQPGWDAPYEAEATVTDSAGKSEAYRFGGYGKAYGKLLEYKIFSGSALMSTTSYSYLTNNQNQNFPETAGGAVPNPSGFSDGHDNLNVPLVERVTLQDGRAFRWKVLQDCDGRACFDAYVRPTKVERGSYVP